MMKFQTEFDYCHDKHSGIAYIDPAESGKPVIILLHGLGADAQSWIFQIPALCAAGYRTIAPDLPGFGRSEGYAQRWSVKRTAKVLADWLAQMRIDRFILAGHSMGGAVALQLALDCNTRVEKIILVNTFAHLRVRYFREARYLARRFITLSFKGLDEQAAQVAARVFPNPGQEEWRKLAFEKISQSDPRIYKQTMLSLAIFDVRRRLQDLNMPALVISSVEDTTVALPIQTEMARGLPDARQVVIQQSGHAVLLDQPEVFNRAMLDFLEGQSPRRLTVNPFQNQESK